MSEAKASAEPGRDGLAASRRLWLTVAVMASTIMQALDTTIVNVALPHMQGQLGANSDQISWVLTSYLVSSAILMPLTGYLNDRIGRRRYLLISIIGFTVASMLCGVAENLVQIVLFRLMQGVFGAALVPMAQAIMADAYPIEQRGRAMAIWGMGVMVGPILGPTLGGWLTQVASWRWTFFVNLPVGILSALMIAAYCPETPRRRRSMDWTGLVLLSLAIGLMQIVLDRGNDVDWFASDFILVSAIVAAVSFLAFVFYSLRSGRRAVFDVSIFRDRNFTSASLVIALLGLGMYGAMFAQPILLENLLGYPTLTAGLVMGPRGITSMLSMMLVGRLTGRLDTRLLVGAGILISAFGSYAMTAYDLRIDLWWAIWPILIQGLGLGMIYVPLSTLSLATLKPEQMSEAAGLFSLLRTVGSSIGISIVSTLYTRLGQREWNLLGGHLNPFNPALWSYLHAHGLELSSALTGPLLGRELSRQANMLALINVMEFITWSFLAMLPFVLLVRDVGKKTRPSAVAD